MATIFNENDSVETRIDKVSEVIRKRLDGSLTAEGKINLDALGKTDAELRAVLDGFAASKTWRDDPSVSARDVAKLLEAHSKVTPLGDALEKLGQNLEK